MTNFVKTRAVLIVEYNIERIEHLLTLYKMSMEQLLSIINADIKKPIQKQDLYKEHIGLNVLKRIDKVFEKGINYYLDFSPPVKSQDVSILFRKQSFGSDLNIGAIKVVNQYEELKHSLSAVAHSAKIQLIRKLPVFSITDNPHVVAKKIRKILAPQFVPTLRDYLKGLIECISNENVYVFEFVETWNKKEKANIDGLFLSPNVIVIKRNQTSFRREIFTLIHELGHYLINEEEIEEVDITKNIQKETSVIERWCNDFAYYFLIGDYDNVISNLDVASMKNDYHHDKIEQISNKTHLSKRALFTRLLINGTVSPYNYRNIIVEMDFQYNEEFKKREEAKLVLKESGVESHGSTPKPILSPLLISTLQKAYFEGVINEYEFSKRLNIKPENLANFLS